MDKRSDLLHRTADLAEQFLDGLPARPVGRPVAVEDLRAALGGPLPARGEDPLAVVESLASAADEGIVATAGPRYFGFVVGGTLPASLAADWLTSAWDQNGGLYVLSPAASVVEEIVAGWLIDLFGLPAGTSVGFTTGATMANFTALAAARHALLARAGWDVERDGLFGAPDVPVVVGAEAHVTIHVSLQMLGLGRERVHRVPTDEQGRMRPDELRAVLASLDGRRSCAPRPATSTPARSTRLPAIAAATRENGGWLHVDGAFGLWAAAVAGAAAVASTASRTPIPGPPTPTNG